MSPGSMQKLFGVFQNLNLLVLIEDLRRGLAAKGNWAFARNLCPLAHGMADGRVVERLQFLSQAVNLKAACDFAAGQLGARPGQVMTFVEKWDEKFEPEWLLDHLLMIWNERLEDALAMQELLADESAVQEAAFSI